jgi:hypothetical protein
VIDGQMNALIAAVFVPLGTGMGPDVGILLWAMLAVSNGWQTARQLAVQAAVPRHSGRPDRRVRNPMMSLSDATAREIAKVLRKHVGMRAIEQIVEELLEIRGDTRQHRNARSRAVDGFGSLISS